MNNSRHTVSVVLCAFNGEKYIKEQLDSILAQTYPVDEIIIQDDCSTDRTVEIITEYTQKHRQVKLFVNDHNMGFNPNFRHALERASCDYIAISDQDDIWYPNKIEKQIQAIGDKDLCGTAYDIGTSMDESHYLPASDNLERYIFGGGVAGHAMLFSKDFLDNRNNWLEGITYDWSLLMNAFFAKGVIILKDAMNWHRRHEKALGNVFHQKTNNKLLDNVCPYFFGWKHYRNLQKKQNWQAMYSFIESHTSEHYQPLAHQLSGLMLQPGLMPLLKLCFKCLKNKHLIYPNNEKTTGIMGNLRAFAFPAIFAYNNFHFDWAE